MLADPFEQFAAVYERGLAVGTGTIRNDTMTFRYRDEVFEFPSIKVHPLAHWNGYFYLARIDDLRRLEAEQHANR